MVISEFVIIVFIMLYLKEVGNGIFIVLSVELF